LRDQVSSNSTTLLGKYGKSWHLKLDIPSQAYACHGKIDNKEWCLPFFFWKVNLSVRLWYIYIYIYLSHLFNISPLLYCTLHFLNESFFFSSLILWAASKSLVCYVNLHASSTFVPILEIVLCARVMNLCPLL